MPRASHQDLRRAFRKLLASPVCYHTASVFDPMSARIAADLGFEVGILGGSVASLQVLAAPDFALITLSEFAEQATRIGRVAQLPVIADADHGYGNALNVMRTVTELERAGVAALTIEDTLLPAQFGRKSTDLISIAEGVGKIRAALEALYPERLRRFEKQLKRVPVPLPGPGPPPPGPVSPISQSTDVVAHDAVPDRGASELLVETTTPAITTRATTPPKRIPRRRPAFAGLTTVESLEPMPVDELLVSSDIAWYS